MDSLAIVLLLWLLYIVGVLTGIIITKKRREKMIKVIERGEVPTARVRCTNCGSLIEYGNEDLQTKYFPYYEGQQLAMPDQRYNFYCPVCGCDIIVKWIIEEV